ncbi:hypothetical protein [Paucimonas lemoignei]|nr:hypothetical protein [Paucimonas lemoignei]
MIAKYLKYLSGALLLLLAVSASADTNQNGGIWADSPVGKCYSSLDDYMVNVFGPDYKDDDNIQIIDATSNSNQYKWVFDKTPGINITRVMLRLEKSQRACAILFIPYASTVREIRKENSTGLPTQFLALDTPPPGFPATEVLYQLDRKTNTYFPQQCTKRSAGKKEKVNCASIFQ